MADMDTSEVALIQSIGQKQPTMILYALKALHVSLAEMIGYEALHSKPAPSLFAEGVDEETLKSWKAKGMESWEDIERETMGLFRDEYWRLYRKVREFGTLYGEWSRVELTHNYPNAAFRVG
jgi:hypothetical protein